MSSRFPTHRSSLILSHPLSAPTPWPPAHRSAPLTRFSARSAPFSAPLMLRSHESHIHDFTVRTLFDFDVLTDVSDAFHRHISVSNQ